MTRITIEFDTVKNNEFRQKFVKCNKLFNKLKLSPFVGRKLFMPGDMYVIPNTVNSIDLDSIPYIGYGIKIYTCHTSDINQFAITAEAYEDAVIRFKRLNPSLKCNVLRLSEIHLANCKSNRFSLKKYLDEQVTVTGKITSILQEVNTLWFVRVVLEKVIVETDNSDNLTFDHLIVRVAFKKYIRQCKTLAIGNVVKFIATVDQYKEKQKFGIDHPENFVKV